MGNKRHPIWLLLKLVFVLLVLAAVPFLVEIVLRKVGVHPWRYESMRAARYAGGPAMHEPDPVLGWRNKPGTYTRELYLPGYDEPAVTTILADGSRRTGRQVVSARARRVAVVGGAFTQGWCLSDDQTFASLLEQSLTGADVENHACVGYGTYQSLLLVERLMSNAPPRVVVYGLVEDHEAINVASYDVMRMLSELAHRRGMAYPLPYCDLAADGTLVRYEPESYPPRRGIEHSAILNAIHRAKLREQWRGRSAAKRAVTLEILRAMHTACRAADAWLVVAVLSLERDGAREYQRFFKEWGVAFVDCRLEWTPRYVVPDEEHPAAPAHDFWAKRMRKAVQDALQDYEPVWVPLEEDES